MNFNTILNLINSIHIEARTAQYIIVAIVIVLASHQAWKTWNTLCGK